MSSSAWPGVAALVAVVAGVTVLAALGVMSASQALPILGGVVVITERLLPRPRRSYPPPAMSAPSAPVSPPSDHVSSALVLAGMGAGVAASYLHLL